MTADPNLNAIPSREISWRLAMHGIALGLLRWTASLVWLLLTLVTPIATTVLVGVALIGLGLVAFFRGLLHISSFHTPTVLVVTALSALTAVLLNALVEWLRPR